MYGNQVGETRQVGLTIGKQTGSKMETDGCNAMNVRVCLKGARRTTPPRTSRILGKDFGQCLVDSSRNLIDVVGCRYQGRREAKRVVEPRQ